MYEKNHIHNHRAAAAAAAAVSCDQFNLKTTYWPRLELVRLQTEEIHDIYYIAGEKTKKVPKLNVLYGIE
jgi:hypothetical protein